MDNISRRKTLIKRLDYTLLEMKRYVNSSIIKFDSDSKSNKYTRFLIEADKIRNHRMEIKKLIRYLNENERIESVQDDVILSEDKLNNELELFNNNYNYSDMYYVETAYVSTITN